MYVKNLGIAGAYFLAAIVGNFVAVSPIGASPIWPAAGVALAGVHLYGKKLLPGLFVGILCAQIHSFQDFSTLEKIIDSMIMGTVIAIGSTLQALFGLWLLRKNNIASDDPLLDEVSILKFIFFGAFVSTIVASSIGATTLLLNSIITLDQIALSWSTWWIGDSIGILIFTPVILIFLAQPRQLWRQRIKPVVLPLLIILSLTYLLFSHSVAQERKQHKANFDLAVERFHSVLSSNIYAFVRDSLVLKGIFDGSEYVSREEFNTMTTPLTAGRTGLFALEWIPRIVDGERTTFEQKMEANFSILEPDEKRILVPAKKRREYFPIAYIQPWEQNQKAFGYDIATNPIAKETIEKAKNTGTAVFSEPIKLIQDEDENYGYVSYAPVFNKQNAAELKGVVASIFNVKDVVQNSIQAEHNLFDFLIKDAKKVIYNNFPEKAVHGLSRFQIELKLPIDVAGRRLIVEYLPSLFFANQNASWTIWLILLGGFLFTGISGIALLILSGRNMLTEELVKLRTQEIKQAKVELQEQNADLIKANELVKKAGKAKDQFIASMSHELRTPLNAVLGFSQITLDGNNLTEEQRENLREINGAGEHLLQLINNILDLAKVEAGKISMAKEDVNFSEIVTSCHSIIKHQLQKKRIAFDYDRQLINTVLLQGDSLRIKQVLLNLLTNAVKYNVNYGSITLHCRFLPDGLWRIEVSDTGIGIPENKIAHLFTPFDRLDQEDSQIEGTGIGLTISKTFVELMHGRIGVNSQDGYGSTFWFEISGHVIDIERMITPPVETTAVAQISSKHFFSILYVDDDEINRLIVERVFKKFKNIKVFLAEDGQKGISILDDIKPDMILLDINMPGMSGYELCPLIKEKYSNRPVIAMSADATDRAIKMSKSVGFDDYLTKPIDIPALQNLVKFYLEKRHAEFITDYSI